MSSGERGASAGATPKRRKVVITGIAGRLGHIVTQMLHRDDGYQVVGLDRRPFRDKPRDVEHHQFDLRSKRTRELFRRGDVYALLHLGVLHAPRATDRELYEWNVGGTARLLEYCMAYEVPKVILVSSANVYGPRPENTQFLTEESPLLAAQAFPRMRNLVELDHMGASFFWRARDIETVILRPVHILGRVRNAPSNYLRLDPIPTLLGFDPMIQAVHERDVARAIGRALEPGARGIYNITGPGELPLSEIAQELGRRTIPIPHPLAKPLWSLAFRLGMSSYLVDEFDFIRYVCMVDGSRARTELGFQPHYSLRETIHAVMASA